MMIRAALAETFSISTMLRRIGAASAIACSLCVTTVDAQERPWSYRNATLPGPVPKVRQAAGALMIFDQVAYRSIDHGATLDSLTGLEGDLCDFFDFSPGISFAVTYESTSRKAKVFFWQGGNTWIKVDSLLDVARPTAGIASGLDWFMATENGSTIYRIGETVTTIKGPSPDAIRQLVLTGTTMVVNVAGRQLSYTTDMGTTWTSVPVDGVGPLHVMNDVVYATSANGVQRLDISKGVVENVGIWPVPAGQAPATLDIDSHVGQLYTITADSAYRMYRLDPTNNTWTRWGYPLPCVQAAASPSVMTIESGWAVVALNIIQDTKDTSGIYAYDLNDFTSVSDLSVDPSANTGLFVTGEAAEIDFGSDIISSELFDMSGRCIEHRSQIHGSSVRLDMQGLPPGVYILSGRRADASIIQRILLR